MTRRKSKAGRPAKKPRIVNGKKEWYCPFNRHWVPEDEMSVSRGRPHTYCRACASEYARIWRSTHARPSK